MSGDHLRHGICSDFPSCFAVVLLNALVMCTQAHFNWSMAIRDNAMQRQIRMAGQADKMYRRNKQVFDLLTDLQCMESSLQCSRLEATSQLHMDSVCMLCEACSVRYVV